MLEHKSPYIHLGPRTLWIFGIDFTYIVSQHLTLRSVESSVIEFSEQGERPSDL